MMSLGFCSLTCIFLVEIFVSNFFERKEGRLKDWFLSDRSVDILDFLLRCVVVACSMSVFTKEESSRCSDVEMN